MRYLGAKTKLLSEIDKLVLDKVKLKDTLTFCDAFSGTGAVGSHFKSKFRIIGNDNLYFSFTITNAKLNVPDMNFVRLGFDPFDYFNNSSQTTKGFVYENYSPGGSDRQYFSEENAGRIDYFRKIIQKWYETDKLTSVEYYYLLGCLLESVSKVANIAGVYGAYLKIWDPRAVKPIKFIKVEDEEESSKYENEVHNLSVIDLINQTSGDVLYLDPPYTSTQYVSQYHVLETIAKGDKPKLTGISGQRNKENKISNWCKKGNAEVEFENVIANANYRHIILSYSQDGILSKDFIEKVLKRHGKADSYEFREISYSKYQNGKTSKSKSHCEYLFYIEKSQKNTPIYASPLNYIGGKYDMIPFLKKNAPKNIDRFIDLFGGGCNVGVNFDAKQILYNDCNSKVKELIEYFRETQTEDIISYNNKMIKKFKLSNGDKDAYVKLREYYNSFPEKKRPAKILFLLVCFSFQHQFRFNQSLEYNNPVGTSGFNDCIKEKLVSFCRNLRQKNIVFESRLFADIMSYINKDSFVYCDPPYLVTLGSYNDGKRGFNGWNEKDEKELLDFLDKLNKRGIKFMLSNVFEHKGVKNTLLLNWIKNNPSFRVVKYPHKARNGRQEIIIINYKQEAIK